MQLKNIMANDKGAVLIGTILVLVAVTIIGVTLITVSTFEIEMATNEKCKEEARYNSESCAISGFKLVSMVSDLATEEGILGIPEGNGKILGITYADPETASTKEAEFAKKVLGTLDDDQVCEDFQLTPPNISMNAAGNIFPAGASANEGTAANRQTSGYSYGIGLGGAGGGGFSKWFVIACRGGSCNNNGRHVTYVRYRRVPSVDGGM